MILKCDWCGQDILNVNMERHAETCDAKPHSKSQLRRTAVEQGIPMDDVIKKVAQDRIKEILSHRERYLEAWIAETGLKPSESMVIEDGSMFAKKTMFVVRRSVKEVVAEMKWRIDEACKAERQRCREAICIGCVEGPPVLDPMGYRHGALVCNAIRLYTYGERAAMRGVDL